MTLRSRLALGLLTIAFILVIPLVLAIRSLDRLRDDARALQSVEFAASLLLGRLREGLFELRRQETRLVLVADSGSADEVARQIAEVDRLVDSLEHYELPAAASDVRRAVRRISRWGPIEYQAALSEKKKTADTISAIYIVPALDAADAGVREAEIKLRERTSLRISQSVTRIRRTQTAAVSGMVLAIAGAALIAFFLTQSIAKPVVALEAGMRAVADGQLGYKLKYDSSKPHEFGRLARSFEEMSRQLAELDKLKAEFVSVASHELKTPINVILGYLSLLDEGIYGQMSPKQIEVHQTIRNQTVQLQRLVQQLLDVSRFEAGGGRIEPKEMDLATMLQELERAFHVLADQRGIIFEIDRRGELPTEVTWDKVRMNEVLGNLLSNAFKFTDDDGKVTLSVERDGSSIVMQVRDTGAGIAADQLSRIFEKFYQADNQRSSSSGGSGLGLAIVKQIVEAHGGSIKAESTRGVGTTFTITMPMQVRRRSSSVSVGRVQA